MKKVVAMPPIDFHGIDDGVLLMSKSGVTSSCVWGTRNDRSVRPVGSVSRLFVSVAALMLIEHADGALFLDATLRDCAPEFVDGLDRSFAEVTLRELLNNTSGIAGFVLDGSKKYPSETSLSLLRQHIESCWKESSRGEFSYNYGNYVLLHHVLNTFIANTDTLPEKGLAAFMKTRIFDPLGMQQTRYVDDADYHTLDNDAGVIPGGACVYSSAYDLEKFLASIQKSWSGETTLLSPSAFRDLVSVGSADSRYALGLYSVMKDGEPILLYTRGRMDENMSLLIIRKNAGAVASFQNPGPDVADRVFNQLVKQTR